MILSNGFVVCDDFKLRKKDVKIENGKITEIGENLSGEEKIDFTDKYILPGFIDTHIHGAYGTRISDSSCELDKITTFEATQGVTSIAITTTSATVQALTSQIKFVKDNLNKINGAKIAGIHLEGPFLNAKTKGAMNADYIIEPDTKILDKFLDAGGDLIKIMTVAPEVEGADEFIKYAVKKGVVISSGHTYATYEEAQNAIEWGVTQATHTFNAMRPYNHREPGVLGAALTNDNIKCEMICDHVHLHPATLQLIYKLKGADKINIVSDSGHAAGLDLKEFTVDGITRYVVDGVIRLKDGTIAGSAKTMADGVKNLILSGIPIEEVSKMASKNPAETLSIYSETGSITVGKYADIAVLDKEYNVVCAFVNGKEYKK